MTFRYALATSARGLSIFCTFYKRAACARKVASGAHAWRFFLQRRPAYRPAPDSFPSPHVLREYRRALRLSLLPWIFSSTPAPAMHDIQIKNHRCIGAVAVSTNIAAPKRLLTELGGNGPEQLFKFHLTTYCALASEAIKVDLNSQYCSRGCRR